MKKRRERTTFVAFSFIIILTSLHIYNNNHDITLLQFIVCLISNQLVNKLTATAVADTFCGSPFIFGMLNEFLTYGTKYKKSNTTNTYLVLRCPQ